MRVALVMVLFIFSWLVLLRLAFGGIRLLWLGLGLVCPSLVIWVALFNIFKLLFLMLGGTRLQLIFVVGRVFEEGPCWIFIALCSSLTLLMFGKGIRVYFGVFWLAVFGKVFLLGGVKGQPGPCRFCGAPDGDGHLFLNVPFHLRLRSVKILSFMILWRWIRLIGPGVCFCMVGYTCFLG